MAAVARLIDSASSAHVSRSSTHLDLPEKDGSYPHGHDEVHPTGGRQSHGLLFFVFSS